MRSPRFSISFYFYPPKSLESSKIPILRNLADRPSKISKQCALTMPCSSGSPPSLRHRARNSLKNKMKVLRIPHELLRYCVIPCLTFSSFPGDSTILI